MSADETRDSGEKAKTGSRDLIEVSHALMPVAVVGLFALGALYTLYFGAELVLPVLIAGLLSVALKPLVAALARQGVPAVLSAAVILSVLLGTLCALIVNLSDPAEEWFDRLPTLQQEIEQKLWPVKRSIEEAKAATDKIEEMTEVQTPDAAEPEVKIKTTSLAEQIVETTWFTFVQFVLALALTFFLLIRDREESNRLIRRYVWKNSDGYEDMIAEAEDSIGRYLRVSGAIYCILGVLTAAVMMAYDMPNPLLWGLLAAALGFLPYIGPLITFTCIAVVALLTFDNWWRIVAPPATYGVLTIIEGWFVTPAVLGRRLTLSPVGVFLSIMFWTWMWGPAGALLAAPILVYLTVLCRHITGNAGRPMRRDPLFVAPDWLKRAL